MADWEPFSKGRTPGSECRLTEWRRRCRIEWHRWHAANRRKPLRKQWSEKVHENNYCRSSTRSPLVFSSRYLHTMPISACLHSPPYQWTLVLASKIQFARTLRWVSIEDRLNSSRTSQKKLEWKLHLGQNRSIRRLVAFKLPVIWNRFVSLVLNFKI